MAAPVPSEFRAGFAVLVGRTNVGKSTLLNALVGTKLAMVTPRPQTTRDAYHGIVHRPEGQIVFVDTPGLFKTAPNKLVQNLHHRVRDALEGIDVIVHVVDPSRPMGAEDHMVLKLVEAATVPRLLCLNKLDLPRLPYRQAWIERGPQYAGVVEVSALRDRNTELLIRAILRHLPIGPPPYPEGQITNVTNEFWIAELIREKIYLLTGQEVPYTTKVQVEQLEDRPDKQRTLYVKAVVLTTDDRHQRMLIGGGGRKIREIGSASRQELEVAMNRKVYLDLAVLVDPNWMERI